jgi:hypothetical protein
MLSLADLPRQSVPAQEGKRARSDDEDHRHPLVVVLVGDLAPLVLDWLTLAEVSAALCVCKDVDVRLVAHPAVVARLCVTATLAGRDGRVDVFLTPAVVDGVPHWRMRAVCTEPEQGPERPARKKHSLTIDAEVGSFAKTGSFLWNQRFSAVCNAQRRVHDLSESDPDGHELDDGVTNANVAETMYEHGREKTCALPLRVTNVVDTKHPHTAYDPTTLDLRMSCVEWTHRRETRCAAHVLDRPHAPDEHPLLVAGAELQSNTTRMKACHARNLRREWSSYATTLSLDLAARDTLASFGMGDVLKRAPPAEADVQSHVQEIVGDAHIVVEEGWNRFTRNTSRFVWRPWVNERSSIFRPAH